MQQVIWAGRRASPAELLMFYCHFLHIRFMESPVPATFKEVSDKCYKGSYLERFGHWAEFIQDMHQIPRVSWFPCDSSHSSKHIIFPNKSTSSRVLLSCGLVNQSLLQFIRTFRNLKKKGVYSISCCPFSIYVTSFFSFSLPQPPRLLLFVITDTFSVPSTELSSRDSELNNSRLLPFNYVCSRR